VWRQSRLHHASVDQPADRRSVPKTQPPEPQPSESPGPKSAGFGRDVVRLASGTTVAQAITVASAPILTRIFSPADFGTAAIFTALSGVLVSVACLCYDQAILLPEHDEDAASLFGIACVASIATGTLFAALCSNFQEPIQRGLHWLGVPGWPWLVGVATFLGGMTAALGYWHSRKRRFGRISWARVSGSAASTSYQLGAGALGFATPAGLVNGLVSGSAVTAVMLGAELGRHDVRQLLSGQRVTRMFAGALRYRKFPLLSTWSLLLNSISWQLPTLVLGFYFNSAIVGFYALGFRMLQLPMSLVGGSIGQVLLQRAAKARHEGQLAEVVRGVYSTLLDIGLLPMAVLGVAAPDIFSSVLGSQWHEAGVYAQILAAWTLVWFVSSPLLGLFSVLEIQGLGLRLNGLIFGSRLAALAVGGYVGSARLAIALFAASGVLVYGYVGLVAMSRSGVEPATVLPETARKLLSVIPPCAALLLLGFLHLNPGVVAGLGFAFIVAGWALLFFRYRTDKMRPSGPAGQ
jgi:lipopolysaccharide exporter